MLQDQLAEQQALGRTVFKPCTLLPKVHYISLASLHANGCAQSTTQTSTRCGLLQSLVRIQTAAVISQKAGCCKSYVRRPRTNSFPFLEAAAPVLLIGLLLEAIVLQQPVAGVLLGRGRSD